MNRRPDNDKFDRWMEDWADVVTRFAYHHGGNWMSAQDVAQETFLRAYRYVGDRGEYPSPGWLFRVASRLVIDEARKYGREAVGTVPDVVPGTLSSQDDPRLEVLEALESLPDRDRECLVLFYFRDWPVERVAHHLGIPSTTVRTRLYRARERFRHLWEVEN